MSEDGFDKLCSSIATILHLSTPAPAPGPQKRAARGQAPSAPPGPQKHVAKPVQKQAAVCATQLSDRTNLLGRKELLERLNEADGPAFCALVARIISRNGAQRFGEFLTDVEVATRPDFRSAVLDALDELGPLGETGYSPWSESEEEPESPRASPPASPAAVGWRHRHFLPRYRQFTAPQPGPDAGSAESETDDEGAADSTESETDVESRLDEDFEDVLMEEIIGHAERQAIRREYREAPDGARLPSNIKDGIADLRRENKNDDDEVADIEPFEQEDELSDEIDTKKDMLDYLKSRLQDDDDGGDGQADTQAEDDPESPTVSQLDDMCDAAEAALEAREAAKAETDELFAEMTRRADTLETLASEVRPADGVQEDAIREIVEPVLNEASELYAHYDNDCNPPVHHEAIYEGIARIDAAKDELCAKVPSLKRSRAELDALDDIRAEQARTDEVIGRREFALLVREIGADYRTDLRYADDAIEALLAATEDYAVEILRKSNAVAIHAKRTMPTNEDIRFAAAHMMGAAAQRP